MGVRRVRRDNQLLRQEFLARGRNAIVATRRLTEGPQLSPNWYLWDGTRFLISTSDGTAKVANIRRDPHMSICIDDAASNGELYVTAYGIGEVITGQTARELSLAIIAKYQSPELVVPHWEGISSRNVRVVIAMAPTRWVWARALLDS
jgi:PPOX class probable F420-dependent enzyme